LQTKHRLTAFRSHKGNRLLEVQPPDIRQ